MERRSDKYTDFNNESNNSRVKKNKLLYDEINSKIGYEEITNFEQSPQFDLSSLNLNKPTREEYQKIKEYKSIIGNEKEKTIQTEEQNEAPKNFDINKVLEEAKKNRKEDELEKKRNLNSEEYNVLSNLNKKYLHKKDFSSEDDDELKELINTITSKTLANEIKDEEEKELLSDLLATTVDIKLENELSKQEIDNLYNKEMEEKNENTDENEVDNSFYTKSLELESKDLIPEDNDEVELENAEDEEKNHFGLKIFGIVLILLLIIAFIVLFILNQLGISFS